MVSIRRMNNQLCQHRVKLCTHCLTFFNSTFNSNTRSRWPSELFYSPRRRNKSLSRIFSIKANFDSMPPYNWSLSENSFVGKSCLLDLSPNQIGTCHPFCDRVLDLQ